MWGHYFHTNTLDSGNYIFHIVSTAQFFVLHSVVLDLHSLEVTLQGSEDGVLVQGLSPVPVEESAGPILIIVRVSMPRPGVVRVGQGEELLQGEPTFLRRDVCGPYPGLS